MRNILLTGPPGIGKSTAIIRIAEALGPERAGGFHTGEIRERGHRVGFQITTLDGERGILAHIADREGPTLGKYRVNVPAIDNIAVPSMRHARESGRLIIIDEIARMEMFSTAFRTETLACLATGRVIGTIQARPDQFLDSIRRRADVHLIELTVANRDTIPQTVLALISQDQRGLVLK